MKNNIKINLQYTTFTDSLPDFIYEGLKQYSAQANGYRPQPQELVGRLAITQHVSENMIYLTAGADEGIHMFIHAFGKHTYIFTPTYIVYTDTEEFGNKLTKINAFKDNNYVISTDNISDATLIYLANPNNPFGYTEKEKILELVKNNPQATIVVDEVYAEFANLSVIDEIKNYPNLAVLRSFSKSYCMAGNRIGYIIASPELINKVKNKIPWAPVSYLSAGAAMTALDHQEYFTEKIVDVVHRRDAFMFFLTEKGFTVLSSKINAVLIKFKTEAEGIKFADYLANNNFVISHGNGNSNVGLDVSFVRISIGTKEEMEMIQEVIALYNTVLY